jgi:2',3'-cyclic-nucleotide 2'-phosphodiesterase (5'-nucleotidase family)
VVQNISGIRHSARSAHRLLLAGLCLGLLFSCGTRETQIILLHTNDIHAWFAPRTLVQADGAVVELGGAPVLAGLMRKYRQENDGRTIYLDGGDVFTGTPISSLTQGLACIEVLNLLAPDAMVLGNHEFDHGMEAQRMALDRASFPLLQANVMMVGRLQPYLPADLIINRNGLQVAILGVNSDHLHQLCQPRHVAGVKVDSSHAVARRWLSKMEAADLRICLSHRGFEEDSLLALAVPGFDLIVGAHSHTVLEKPVRVGDSWIVQAGDQGRYLGVDTLDVVKGKGIVRIRGGLLPVLAGAAEPAPDVAELVAAQEREVDAQLGEVVADLAGPWQRDSRGESNLGNWLCAAIRLGTKADIGLWNSGGIRKDLPAGPVSRRDLWEIAPFGNEILVVPLSGGRIRSIFLDQVERGGQHLHFDGLRVTDDGQGRPDGFLVGGRPLEDQRRYRVALSDYVWDQLRQPADSLLAVTRTGLLDRDLLTARARDERVITPVLDGRWGPGEARAQR